MLFLLLILLAGIIPLGFYLDHRADRAVSLLEKAKDVPGLLELYKDYQQGHKNSARLTLMVRALGNLGDRRAVGPLIKAFEDPKTPSAVCIAVAEALGKLKDLDALPVLFKALRYQEGDLYRSVEAAIVNFGPAAIEPLLGQLMIWEANPAAARALKKLNWTPITDEDRVHFWLGLRDIKTLKENQELIRRVLHVDSPQWEEEPLYGFLDDYTLFALVSLGYPEDIPNLIQVLQTKEVAEAYINSGNPELMRAAREWATRNGYKIKRGSSGTSTAWGSLR
jgi:HEAT repeat protein